VKETTEASGHSAVRPKEGEGSTEKKTVKSIPPADSMMAGPERAITVASVTQTNQINQIDQRDQTNQKDQINQINQTDRMGQQKDQINQIDQTNQINQRNQIDKTDQTNQIARSNDLNQQNVPNDQRMAASPHLRADVSTDLIATEEEVKQFFANYTDRYTGRDLDGFLSLFSQRVIQNRQYGLERIRKIYTDFFNQSQEIQYSLDDIKIEIYQNGVEVKARYEINQTLRRNGERKIWRGQIRWTLVKEHGVLKILSLDYQHQKSP